MSQNPRFRVMSTDGLVSYDTFLIADRQPDSVQPGCLLLVDERTGKEVAVHETRIVPAQLPRSIRRSEDRWQRGSIRRNPWPFRR